MWICGRLHHDGQGDGHAAGNILDSMQSGTRDSGVGVSNSMKRMNRTLMQPARMWTWVRGDSEAVGPASAESWFRLSRCGHRAQ